MLERPDYTIQNETNSWELMWSPYDEDTYHQVLALVESDDIVLEIGAGDLRLARQIASLVNKVYCFEINEAILNSGWASYEIDRPKNLFPICGDALSLPFPSDVTTAVLLMRHCTHFSQFMDRLRSIGCQKLITNWLKRSIQTRQEFCNQKFFPLSFTSSSVTTQGTIQEDHINNILQTCKVLIDTTAILL